MEIIKKSEILKSDYFQLIKKVHYCFTHKNDYRNYKTNEIELTYKEAMLIYEVEHRRKEYKDCYKIIHADNKRYNNLLNRILYYLTIDKCIFFTLTFRDDVLDSTDENTRRKYITRFLKSISSGYVANIDFGNKLGREHYHGVIIGDNLNVLNSWSYGFSNGQIIKDNKYDCMRISKYVLKITNHFIKESVSKNRAIYSRDLINWGPNKNKIVKLKKTIYKNINLFNDNPEFDF